MRYSLLNSVCDLIVAQKNVLHSLIWDHILYEYEQGDNATEATKKVCCAKGERHS